MPEVRLDPGDAAGLAESSGFLTGWLSYDPGRLAASRRSSPGVTGPGPRVLRITLRPAALRRMCGCRH